MSGDALGFLAGYLLVATASDIRTRTIPNWVTLAGLCGGTGGAMLGAWSWSYLWMLLIMVPLLVADVGLGDVKASMVIGGFFGVWSMAILLLAFGAMLPFWLAYDAGWSRYPGSWPFFCWITGATCGIVAYGLV